MQAGLPRDRGGEGAAAVAELVTDFTELQSPPAGLGRTPDIVTMSPHNLLDARQVSGYGVRVRGVGGGGEWRRLGSENQG